MMKDTICAWFGILGGALAAMFGGWDAAFAALLSCMAIDYLSGSVVALVFHQSKKSPSGSYTSAYGFKGLCKKGLMLLLVLVGVQIDTLLGIDYGRNAVCLGLCSNEILSIVENLGLAGIPMPKFITESLEQLREN